ncbi:UNC93-like protein [Bacillus rossius redtenbacheri]|uniref:UNC93-like protein n=1 Tax=Bacillus rossius redtenbacheri TaxID=93214 RepID=UPI002FDD0A26
MFSTMTEQNHLQTSARRFLNALLSEGVRDLQRRHSDGGHVVTISSLVLAKSVNRPPPPRPLARPAVVQSEESPQSLAQKDRFWILCNVVCLGVAFMILSTAFIGTVDLQSSLNANQGLGTISLTSMYVISIVSNLCLPTVLIRWLGCKRTVAVCFLAYIPFIVAQLDGSSYALVPGAVLIGVALGPIHCAAGAHLQLLARCSAPRGPGVEAALLRLLSVFHVFVSLSQVWGSGVTALARRRERDSWRVRCILAQGRFGGRIQRASEFDAEFGDSAPGVRYWR